jgi:hypothetical protein
VERWGSLRSRSEPARGRWQQAAPRRGLANRTIRARPAALPTDARGSVHAADRVQLKLTRRAFRPTQEIASAQGQGDVAGRPDHPQRLDWIEGARFIAERPGGVWASRAIRALWTRRTLDIGAILTEERDHREGSRFGTGQRVDDRECSGTIRGLGRRRWRWTRRRRWGRAPRRFGERRRHGARAARQQGDCQQENCQQGDCQQGNEVPPRHRQSLAQKGRKRHPGPLQ